MKLALRLGKTLAELGAMSSSELTLWAAYDQLTPVGDERLDWLCVRTAVSSAARCGANVNLEDRLPYWLQPEKKDVSTPEETAGELEILTPAALDRAYDSAQARNRRT